MRGAFVVDTDLDLRRQHLLLDLQIGDPGNARQLFLQHRGLAAQRVEIIAEDLDRDLRTHT